jgi:hypothetical protein
MAVPDRGGDPRTRTNVAGAKRMAIGLGTLLLLGAGTWVIFGPHDRPADITHQQVISGPNPGEGKDATQPPPGMPKPNNSSGPPAAKPSSDMGVGTQ